jgi:hypothetical protein
MTKTGGWSGVYHDVCGHSILPLHTHPIRYGQTGAGGAAESGRDDAPRRRCCCVRCRPRPPVASTHRPHVFRVRRSCSVRCATDRQKLLPTLVLNPVPVAGSLPAFPFLHA